MSSKSIELVLPVSMPSSYSLQSRDAAQRQQPSTLRKEIAVFLGEFIGTFMFLFLAFAGTQIALESVALKPFTLPGENSPPEVSKLIYIAFSFGAALAVNVAIFADVSGGMFNPAVTLAQWIVGLVRWKRAVHSIFAQYLAGICAAAVVSAMLPGPLPVATVLDSSMSIPRGLFLEMFLTAQLILTILMLPASSAKPMYIGLALFVAEICGVFFTGGSLNPARSFGPAVIVGFKGYHWIYWLGPAMGAGLGAGAFELVKFVQNEGV